MPPTTTMAKVKAAQTNSHVAIARRSAKVIRPGYSCAKMRLMPVVSLLAATP
jgi:hypothetical protein